jgi:ubiquitin-protein ligase
VTSLNTHTNPIIPAGQNIPVTPIILMYRQGRRLIAPILGTVRPSLRATGRWADMSGWWNRYPLEFEAEKSALDALGCSWRIDEVEWQSGRLAIDIELLHEEQRFRLTAEYPDSYPYFPPQVTLHEHVLQRHQHPVGRNLCLLAREGEDWRPGQDTLACLLAQQFPLVLAVNAAELSSDFVAEHEDHVGEPFSSFVPTDPNCMIVVPDETPGAEIAGGRLVLDVRATALAVHERLLVSGMIKAIHDLRGNPLIEVATRVPSFSQSMTGFWLRLPERPSVECSSQEVEMAQHFLNLMKSSLPEFEKALRAAKLGQTLIAGFVYRDEVVWRESADDWFFLAVRIRREAKRTRPAQVQLALVRADWGGENAWMRRAPVLLPLRGKSVMVVGLGSLGSPLVLHLARAGIAQMDLIDCDWLQVGNTVRWALGWQFAGLHKAHALALHLEHEYPYTSVKPHHLHIGSPVSHGDMTDYQRLRSISEDCDLIIDATANHRVSHFLADLARELGKPYLWLTTTHGAAGGVVGRVIPGRTAGCWHCFQHRLADGSIPLPADSGGETIQPGGCSQATFIGAGLDSDEVALLASRLAVATLVSGAEGGYPDFNWNVAVADFWRDGFSIAPEWATDQLHSHPSCAHCNSV